MHINIAKDYLQLTLENITNPDLTGKRLDEELNRADGVVKVVKQYIEVEALCLKATIAQDEFLNPDSSKLPKSLEDRAHE